jgi:uncharacterized protein (DUF302 family)
MTVFAVMDDGGEAREAGGPRETTLVIHRNPLAETPAIAREPQAVPELRFKVVVWEDGLQTKVSYTAPNAISRVDAVVQAAIDR